MKETPADDASGADILVYDRRAGRLVPEPVTASGLLRLAYTRAFHPVLGGLLFRTGFVSRVLGWYCDSRLSRRHVEPAIRAWGLDPAEFARPVCEFRTFNEFFTRRLAPGRRPFVESDGVLCAPADGRALVFRGVGARDQIEVKGSPWTLTELLGRDEESAGFDGADVAIVRLAPCDYHRFHFPAGGRILDEWEIPGAYESVHPFALRRGLPVLCRNHRFVTVLDLDGWGRAAYVEVGAFGVGAIVHTHRSTDFRKGDEKGYFKFGGSTVVLVLQGGAGRFDAELLEYSGRGIETLLRAGEPLAHLQPGA